MEYWKTYLQDKKARHDAMTYVLNQGHPISVPHQLLAPEEYALASEVERDMLPLTRYVMESEWRIKKSEGEIKPRGPIINSLASEAENHF